MSISATCCCLFRHLPAGTRFFQGLFDATMALENWSWNGDELRSAKGYSMDEINEYLEGIRRGSALPLYWHRSEIAKMPMTALIPPYLEDAFVDARRRGSKYGV